MDNGLFLRGSSSSSSQLPITQSTSQIAGRTWNEEWRQGVTLDKQNGMNHSARILQSSSSSSSDNTVPLALGLAGVGIALMLLLMYFQDYLLVVDGEDHPNVKLHIHDDAIPVQDTPPLDPNQTQSIPGSVTLWEQQDNSNSMMMMSSRSSLQSKSLVQFHMTSTQSGLLWQALETMKPIGTSSEVGSLPVEGITTEPAKPSLEDVGESSSSSWQRWRVQFQSVVTDLSRTAILRLRKREEPPMEEKPRLSHQAQEQYTWRSIIPDSSRDRGSIWRNSAQTFSSYSLDRSPEQLIDDPLNDEPITMVSGGIDDEETALSSHHEWYDDMLTLPYKFDPNDEVSVNGSSATQSRSGESSSLYSDEAKRPDPLDLSTVFEDDTIVWNDNVSFGQDDDNSALSSPSVTVRVFDPKAFKERPPHSKHHKPKRSSIAKDNHRYRKGSAHSRHDPKRDVKEISVRPFIIKGQSSFKSAQTGETIASSLPGSDVGVVASKWSTDDDKASEFSYKSCTAAERKEQQQAEEALQYVQQNSALLLDLVGATLVDEANSESWEEVAHAQIMMIRERMARRIPLDEYSEDGESLSTSSFDGHSWRSIKLDNVSEQLSTDSLLRGTDALLENPDSDDWEEESR